MITEQDLTSALKAQVAQREDEDRTEGVEDADCEARCRSCGATLLFRGNLTTQKCVYCSAPIHLEIVAPAEKRIPGTG